MGLAVNRPLWPSMTHGNFNVVVPIVVKWTAVTYHFPCQTCNQCRKRMPDAKQGKLFFGAQDALPMLCILDFWSIVDNVMFSPTKPYLVDPWSITFYSNVWCILCWHNCITGQPVVHCDLSELLKCWCVCVNQMLLCLLVWCLPHIANKTNQNKTKQNKPKQTKTTKQTSNQTNKQTNKQNKTNQTHTHTLRQNKSTYGILWPAPKNVGVS